MLFIQKLQNGKGFSKERGAKVMRFKRLKAAVLAMAVTFTSVAGGTAIFRCITDETYHQ